MNSVVLGKLSTSEGLSSPICELKLRTHLVGLMGGLNGTIVNKHCSVSRTIMCILTSHCLVVPMPHRSRLTKPKHRPDFREMEGAGCRASPTLTPQKAWWDEDRLCCWSLTRLDWEEKAEGTGDQPSKSPATISQALPRNAPSAAQWTGRHAGQALG